MLLRLTVALVLVGLGLLLAGFARDALGLIYLSILCTAIAGVALIVYVQVTRRQAVRLATEHLEAGDAEDTGRSGPAAVSDAAVPGGPSSRGPDEDVEPPAARGGWQGVQGDPFRANTESGTDQPQPGTGPGPASGEET